MAALPRGLQLRIIAKLEKARQDPFHFFERLKERTEYKLRVGDYRVIVSIEGFTIKVHTVGHRKNIYDC